MASSQEGLVGTVYQFKVILKDSRPAIWRRFLVPEGITLHRLHLILQAIMGWDNYHLYRFEIGKTEYAEPHPANGLYDLPLKNSKRAKLGRLMTKKGVTFLYEYDFGDSWIHEIVAEDILEREPDKPSVACLAGERACPPEDCGGIWGYEHLLEVIRDSTHEEYDETTEWVGGDFDPEAFDLECANKKLKHMRVRG